MCRKLLTYNMSHVIFPIEVLFKNLTKYRGPQSTQPLTPKPLGTVAVAAAEGNGGDNFLASSMAFRRRLG